MAEYSNIQESRWLEVTLGRPTSVGVLHADMAMRPWACSVLVSLPTWQRLAQPTLPPHQCFSPSASTTKRRRSHEPTMASPSSGLLVTAQPDDCDSGDEPRSKRPRLATMAPSIGADVDCVPPLCPKMPSPRDKRGPGTPCVHCDEAVTLEAVNEEEICLCPKPGANSGQVTKGGVRVRAPSASRASRLLALIMRRVCPVVVMALLCLSLWSSLHWKQPELKPQPGVRGRKPHKPRHQHHAHVLNDYHASRASKTLPSLPEFSVEPLQLHIDTQTERIMDIYCRGPLLHAVQMANVYPDSKHFVDMPIKSNSSVFDVLLDFQQSRLSMTEYNRNELDLPHDVLLRQFLDTHFDAPGSDLVPITPFDYQEHFTPPMIAGIQDDELREWALALHHLWRHLGRMPHTHVTSSFLHAKALNDPHLHRKQNVLIVPGGRFRESYYWDSYWIVQGLLVSNMRVTARGVVNNLLEYVAEFGFVPNGGRIYYLTRSQPPMLSDMVKLVARKGRNASCIDYDSSYLRSTLPILEQEYSFWMQRGPGGHAVELQRPHKDGGMKTYVLNRYISNANHPRPESYREDVDVAAEIFGETVMAEHGEAKETEANKAKYYNDVIAAAESGWDFSSRWLRDEFDMRSMFTSCVVPVDLNAILYRMERNLMAFHAHLKHKKRAHFYEAQAEARRAAMDAILWNETQAAWKDYHLCADQHSPVVSVSDYSPLWAKAFDPDDTERLERVVASLQESGLLQVGGIQTTTTFTGQQWDAPNAWPPEQDIIIEGLLATNTPEAHELARELAKTWVHTSLIAWRDTGLMFEKYNATEVGGLGVGGEYFPQFGFGWTNGVILKMLTIHQNLLLE